MSKIYATALPPVLVLNGWHTDEEVEQATRILIHHLLGGFLFPDTTKNKVKLFFFKKTLNTFEGCGQYSWGSAVLAYLYRAMCLAADFESSTACGCLILLQIWAWERLPMVRPQGILLLNNLGDLPYRARWFCPHEWPTVMTHVIRAYRDQFDHCTDRKFEFRPYEDILPYLPYYCRDRAGMWTSQTHGFRAISLESTTTLADPTIDRDATLTHIDNISLDNLGEHNFIVNVPDEDYYAARQEDIVQARRRDRRRER
ncbi:serine/threonine-protein phosphatase 7 long form homolog isoform X2 [Ipomoea triloba]|uniref:serine/threonine-protein phosphatase 7 long form homolog isoform X2 n=1 Tax=Ipomoea triloba TaxID=35885 RepID=UPI00125DDEE3|nr:serine/threonine-protein phosphatase 7 long form homolog isoform X2 [Ipomoea triloba]